MSNRNALQVNGQWLPTPSEMTWGLKDISDESAGRTQDGQMHKHRIAQKVVLQLIWWGTGIGETAEILQAFNPEYITVNYHDAMRGVRETRTFYVGDRTSIFKRIRKAGILYDRVAFDIIER